MFLYLLQGSASGWRVTLQVEGMLHQFVGDGFVWKLERKWLITKIKRSSSGVGQG